MAHLREQIIAAAAVLLANLATTGGNVFAERDTDAEPLSDAQLPGITVAQGEEVTTPIGTAYPRTTRATLGVVLGVHVKARTGQEARQLANQAALEVQQALYADRFLGGLCKTSTLQQSDWSLTTAGEKAAGVLELVYQVEYFFKEDRPDVAT